MTQLRSQPEPTERASANSDNARDRLSGLHKMSTTAGLGSTEYVAINPVAVSAGFLGLASALALVENTLLIIPAVAVVCAAVAMWQIRAAGGTQTGRGIALAGLVLAVGLAGYVIYREATRVSSRLADEKTITELVNTFGQKVAAQKFNEAYMMLSPRFRERVKKPQFDLLWSYVGCWEPGKFTLSSITSNGRVEFEANPATGEEAARTMCILSFSGKPTDDRIEFYFHQGKDSPWTIENIPKFFPEAEGAKPR